MYAAETSGVLLAPRLKYVLCMNAGLDVDIRFGFKIIIS